MEQGRAIFITGTSSGIGRASALALDKAGFQIIASVRKEEDAKLLRKNLSNSSHVILVDVTDSQSVQNAAEEINLLVKDKGLYGLLNNAGVEEFTPIEAMSLECLRSVFEVNFFGTIQITKALLPQIRKSEGRIINMSARNAHLTTPYSFPFCATKSGIESFTKSLRFELSPWNVDVITINPSSIITKTSSSLMSSANSNLTSFSEECRMLYKEQFISAAKMISHDKNMKSKPPEAVAKIVLKAFTAKHPKTHYQVGSRQINT